MPGSVIATIPWHQSNNIMLQTLRTLMPVVQAVVLPDGLYQLAAEWTNEDGLSKTHRVKVGYEYNDEELAIHRGERQDDGSYVYVSPKGRVHTCPAEKASIYDKSQAEQQQRYQTWKQTMGGNGPTVDCEVV